MADTALPARRDTQSWGPWDWAALALLCLATVFFNWPLITPWAEARYSYPEGDFYDQFHAFAVYEHDRLWAGELPLWNPYTYGGHPFWADVQAAVLYPPSLLTMALSGPGGFAPLWLELEAMVHLLLGAVFAYLFMRRLLNVHAVPRPPGWRGTVGPLIAALTFGFGGYLSGYPSQQTAILETQIWLPLLLLLLDVGLAEREWRALLGAGLVWGIALLAGHPQSAMYVAYAALFYGAYRSWQLRLKWRFAIPALLAWFGIGLGLSAVQWLPALEFMRLSVRSSLGYEELAGGLAWRDLLQFWVPGAFTHWSPMYVGILPLFMAVVGCWGWRKRGRRGTTLFWLVLALVSLVLSLGDRGQLYRAFYWMVPGFRLFRSQERAIYLVSFCLAVLAGYGWHWLAAEETEDNAVRRTSVALLALGIVSLAALVAVWLLGRSQLEYDLPGWARRLALLCGLAWGGWALVRWVPRRSLWAGALALGMVWIDLVAVNMPRDLEPGPAALRVYDSSWLEAVLEDKGLYRMANEWGLPGNYGCLVQRQDMVGASPLRLQAHKDVLDALPHWRLWQLFGVRYVATWEHDCPAPYPCHRIAMRGEEWAKDTVYLHRIEDDWPRAWIAHRARRVQDAEALALLADPAFDPFAEVLLADPVEEQWILDLADGPSTAKVIELSPERIVVQAELGAPGWLVLGEWDYPGWVARVNGQPREVYRAHYGLRAVPLEEGAQVVEFRYRPASLYLGALLSLLTMLGLLVGMIALSRRREVS